MKSLPVENKDAGEAALGARAGGGGAVAPQAGRARLLAAHFERSAPSEALRAAARASFIQNAALIEKEAKVVAAKREAAARSSLMLSAQPQSAQSRLSIAVAQQNASLINREADLARAREAAAAPPVAGGARADSPAREAPAQSGAAELVSPSAVEASSAPPSSPSAPAPAAAMAPGSPAERDSPRKSRSASASGPRENARATKPANLTEVAEDVLSFRGSNHVLVQQMDCYSRSARGLAERLREALPFADVCASIPPSARQIGDCLMSLPEEGKTDAALATLFAQRAPGPPGKFAFRYRVDKEIDTGPVRLVAFRTCLAALSAALADESARGRTHVVFPRGIGCGSAGGAWTAYRAEIERFAELVPFHSVIIAAGGEAESGSDE